MCGLVWGLVSAVRYLVMFGCRMARGNEKIKAQQKNAEKLAKLKKQQSKDQKATAGENG